MEGIRVYIPMVVLALLGLVLQFVLSNAIQIGNATPNFVIAFALIIAVVYPVFGSVVIGFLMGLLYNLLGTGPVGGLALVLTIMTYLLMQLFRRMEAPNFFFSLGILFVGAFLCELFYGILTGVFVSGISVSEALRLRALPCGVYDALITCVLYPLPALLMRVMANRGQDAGVWKM